MTIAATPAAGWTFGGWSGCDTATGADCALTMTSQRSVSATFTQRFHTVAVEYVAGPGSVTSSIGIDCPAGPCSATVAWGTAVTLAANTSGGSQLQAWGGCCNGAGGCGLTVTGDVVVNATFRPLLTVTTTGPGSIVGDGIDCGADCTEYDPCWVYLHDNVQLTGAFTPICPPENPECGVDPCAEHPQLPSCRGP